MEGLEGTAIRLAVRDPSCPQAPVLARSRRNPVLFRGGSCGWLRTRPEIVLPDTAFTDPPPARRLQIAYTWGGGGTRISSRGFPPWSTERVPGTSRASQILSILIRASRAQIATDVSPAGRPAAYLANSVIREQTAGRHVGDSKPHDLDAGVLRCLSSPVVTCHMPIRKLASPPGPDNRSTALPMIACSSASSAGTSGAGSPASPAWSSARRRLSSSAHRPIRSSSAAGFTSPVTTGVTEASQVNERAPSRSSHAPPSLPLSEAAARAAAHYVRTPEIHSSISAELPFRSIRSASETWTRALTGCPARSGSSPAASNRRMR